MYSSPLWKSCQSGTEPPVNANVNSIFLKERYRKIYISFEIIEFTFAFTGGSSDPGTIPGMGLSGRLLASLGCLAQPRLLFAVWLAWPRSV